MRPTRVTRRTGMFALAQKPGTLIRAFSLGLLNKPGGVSVGFFQDLKFAIRVMVGSPGFTLLAVLTLAFGIGVNSTIFTLVNGVFFKGLPFENPQEIVAVSARTRTADRG